MVNYGQSKGLVQVQETNTYNGQDPFVLARPMALEFNPEQEEAEDEQLEVDDGESEPQQ